jgi:hypothetical protein
VLRPEWVGVTPDPPGNRVVRLSGRLLSPSIFHSVYFIQSESTAAPPHSFNVNSWSFAEYFLA